DPGIGPAFRTDETDHSMPSAIKQQPAQSHTGPGVGRPVLQLIGRPASTVLQLALEPGPHPPYEYCIGGSISELPGRKDFRTPIGSLQILRDVEIKEDLCSTLETALFPLKADTVQQPEGLHRTVEPAARTPIGVTSIPRMMLQKGRLKSG